jgi:hypothetical protein
MLNRFVPDDPRTDRRRVKVKRILEEAGRLSKGGGTPGLLTGKDDYHSGRASQASRQISTLSPDSRTYQRT